VCVSTCSLPPLSSRSGDGVADRHGQVPRESGRGSDGRGVCTVGRAPHNLRAALAHHTRRQGLAAAYGGAARAVHHQPVQDQSVSGLQVRRVPAYVRRAHHRAGTPSLPTYCLHITVQGACFNVPFAPRVTLLYAPPDIFSLTRARALTSIGADTSCAAKYVNLGVCARTAAVGVVRGAVPAVELVRGGGRRERRSVEGDERANGRGARGGAR